MTDSSARVFGLRPAPRLGPAERVRSRNDFGALFRSGRRGGDDVVRVIVSRNGLGHSRVASAVQRRFGRAVRRNRLRRLYKEAFRLEKERLPRGIDVLCSPPRGTGIPSLEQLRAALVEVLHKTVARLSEQEERAARRRARGERG